MGNDSVALYFNLTMFVNLGYYRYPAFILCSVLYAFIVFANLVIIMVISRERSLHQPMYIFIAYLSVNSLYGSAGFFIRFLMDLLSDTHLIPRLACFTQIFVIYTYAANELTILSIMAYDRYVAVCQPLHYHNKMTLKMVSKLVAFAWIYPMFSIVLCVYLSYRLPLCGNKIPKLFCANWTVVKLSCVATVINNIVGMLVTTTTIFLPLAFVLYTYLRIVLACRKCSSKFKNKVFHNCLPHVITFVNFSITLFCDIALSRNDIEELNPYLAVILSLEFVVTPPILNPLVYGLKLFQLKRLIFNMLSCSNIVKK